MANREVPWVFTSRSATETARFLISQANNSVQAAHSAVARAAKELKKKHGRPPEGADPWWLFVAYQIQQQEHCKDSQALCRAADLAYKDEAVDEKAAMVRRLKRKLKGAGLARSGAVLRPKTPR
jgi:hypothetical protein